MNGRERVFSMLAGQPVDRLAFLPITMMFAADQIGAKYGQYATDHRVLAEAQVCAAERFEIDCVSCISDPAREAADCGARIEYFEDQPPAIDEAHALLRDKSTLASLKIPDPSAGARMRDCIDGVALLKRRVGDSLLVEGWIEGPCAEAADLRGINALMLDFHDDPDFIHELFGFVLEMELPFAQAQIQAGADWIGVGDAAASLVGPRIYQEFIWPYEKRMVDALHAMGTSVRLHICGNTSRILAPMGRLGCEVVELDSMAPIAQARHEMGPEQILLGNIDPVAVLRNGTPDLIVEAIAACHRDAGVHYMVGAGCEVPRDTPPKNLRALRNYAKTHKP